MTQPSTKAGQALVSRMLHCPAGHMIADQISAVEREAESEVWQRGYQSALPDIQLTRDAIELWFKRDDFEVAVGERVSIDDMMLGHVEGEVIQVVRADGWTYVTVRRP